MKFFLRISLLTILLFLGTGAIYSQTLLLEEGTVPSSSSSSPDPNFVVDIDSEGLLEVKIIGAEFIPEVVLSTPSGMVKYISFDGIESSVLPADELGEYELQVSNYYGRSQSSEEFVIQVKLFDPPRTLRGTESNVESYLEDESISSSFNSGKMGVWYALEASGESGILLLESYSFDTYLELHLNDGRIMENDDYGASSGTDSGIMFRNLPEGKHYIFVSSFDGYVENGGFTLHVEELPEAQVLELDRPVESDLEEYANYESASFEFEVPSDGVYFFDMESEDFDTYLRMELPNGEMVQNDDGGTGQNSSISTFLKGGDLVYIFPESYSGGGRYTLLVRGQSGAERLRVGDDISSYLGEDEKLLYELQGFEGDYVNIELYSDDFDTVLSYFGDDFNNEVDDSEGDGTYFYASTASYYFEEDASVFILVKSYYSDSYGEFRLKITQSTEEPPQEYEDYYEIALGSSVSSSLTASDTYFDEADGPADIFVVRANEGDFVDITLVSEVFDSYLYVITPGGEVLSDDDGAGNLDSLVSFVAEYTGEYVIGATALGNDGYGPYTLHTSQKEILYAEGGSLSRQSPRDIRGHRYESFKVFLSQDQIIRANVNSSDFDTVIYVLDVNGDQVDWDDDSGATGGSAVEFIVPESGEYTFTVSSFSSDSLGDFMLTLLELEESDFGQYDWNEDYYY